MPTSRQSQTTSGTTTPDPDDPAGTPPRGHATNTAPRRHGASQQVLDDLDDADRREREGLALLVAAGSELRQSEQARQQVVDAVAGAQGYAARVVVPSGRLAPAATPVTNEVPAPAPQTALQQVVTPTQPTPQPLGFWQRLLRKPWRILIAFAAFIVTAIVGVIVWNVLKDHAGGSHGWATNGGIEALIILVTAVLVGLLVLLIVNSGEMTTTPASPPQQTMVVVTAEQLAAMAPQPQPVPATTVTTTVPVAATPATPA